MKACAPIAGHLCGVSASRPELQSLKPIAHGHNQTHGSEALSLANQGRSRAGGVPARTRHARLAEERAEWLRGGNGNGLCSEAQIRALRCAPSQSQKGPLGPLSVSNGPLQEGAASSRLCEGAQSSSGRGRRASSISQGVQGGPLRTPSLGTSALHRSRGSKRASQDRAPGVPGGVVCQAGYEGNGAAYGNGAAFGSLAVAQTATTPRRFVNHLEGGGQVRATVSSKGSDLLVSLEASLDTKRYDSARPLLLHWGIHRSDSSSWFLLDPSDAPPGTAIVQLDTSEAMRTPFQAPKDDKRRGAKKGGSQVVEEVEADVAVRTLAIKFSPELAPFSLDFVLYQPPSGDDVPEKYIGSPSSANFSVPVGMDKGQAEPLGATRLPDGSVNFALYSRHAQGVVLCLYEAFSPEPTMEIDLEPSCHRTGNVWHVRLLDTGTLAKYGYRCKGEVTWDAGSRFFPRAVLLDPYAKILAPPVAGQDELPSPAAALGAMPPLEVPEFDWHDDFPPRIPQEDLSVYRMNVGAYTIGEESGVPTPERGTFLGVARKASYLRSLGINAVLLQPVASFDEDQGSYYPFNFFAPMPAYGVSGDPALAARDLKLMVRELHKWGIEVLLEVVFSNTAEQSDADPKNISFRGIDNKTYYLTDEAGAQVVPDYGAPNAFNCNHPVVHTLILDALSHWVGEYHVDGFSFLNVQSLLAGPHGQPVSRPLLVEALAFEPVLAGCKLIADPCSPLSGVCGVYEIPHWWRWMELNSRFKMDVRRFLNGHQGQLSAMATRITGSADIFSSGRGPSYGLNFVTGFTGLTLADLVSYTVDSEASWGCGVDGPSEDPYVSTTRLRQLRNFVCALYLSLGIPVFLMGDEYGNTKEGKLNQLDWDGVFHWPNVESDLAQQISSLVTTLSGIRRRHRCLERKEFWFAGDITWHGVRGTEQPDWDNPHSCFLAYMVQIRSGTPGEDSSGSAGPGGTSYLGPSYADPRPTGTVQSCVYVAFNAQQYAVQLELPTPPLQHRWVRLIDTSQDHPNEITPVALDASGYELSHFSVLALEARHLDAPIQ